MRDPGLRAVVENSGRIVVNELQVLARSAAQRIPTGRPLPLPVAIPLPGCSATFGSRSRPFGAALPRCIAAGTIEVPGRRCRHALAFLFRNLDAVLVGRLHVDLGQQLRPEMHFPLQVVLERRRVVEDLALVPSPFQQLRAAVSLLRVHDEQLLRCVKELEEPNSATHGSELLCEAHRRGQNYPRGRLFVLGQLGRFWPGLLGGLAEVREKQRKLRRLAVLQEDGLPVHELQQDAPGGPRVDARIVAMRAQQQLRSAVPQRHDRAGVPLIRRVVFAPKEGARKTPIRDLQNVGRRDQQVARLDVSMQHAVLGQMRQAADQLVAVALDMSGRDREATLQQPAQVVLHELEDHVHPLGALKAAARPRRSSPIIRLISGPLLALVSAFAGGRLGKNVQQLHHVRVTFHLQ
mmetsp:Transcript_12376/g.45784  ORF Transcript_12376/g.45784 Transcript_12376/m.45784 type:complete len:407 (+) Transcript_12376:297-1517(+)